MASTPHQPIPVRTALITGGASGIGLALTNHLLEAQSPQWRIIIADLNETGGQETSPPGKRLTAFKYAFEWSNGRIDFFAANAGRTGSWRKDFGLPALTDGDDDDNEEDKGPGEAPDVKLFDVLVFSQFYGLKCFLHYICKTRRQLKRLDNADPYYPCMVSTSSATGLYNMPIGPMYGAGKAAVISLVRSLGQRLYFEEGLVLNAICPGWVDTMIFPEAAKNAIPDHAKTPMSVITGLFDQLIAPAAQGGTGDEKDHSGITGKEPMVGQTVETSATKLYWHRSPEYSDANVKFLMEFGLAQIRTPKPSVGPE